MYSISGVMIPCRAYQSCVTACDFARSGRRVAANFLILNSSFLLPLPDVLILGVHLPERYPLSIGVTALRPRFPRHRRASQSIFARNGGNPCVNVAMEFGCPPRDRWCRKRGPAR